MTRAASRSSREVPLGRRERRKLETREALLEAALRLFGERGIYATRVEDVTQDADVGKGAFYNYFDSKTALITALVKQGVEHLERSQLHGDRGEGRALEGRVAELARAHDRFFRAEPGYALVFHQARGLLEVEGDRSRLLQAAFDEYLRVVSSFLFPGRPPRAVLHQAAAAALGAILGYRSFVRAAGLSPSPLTLIRFLAGGVESLG